MRESKLIHFRQSKALVLALWALPLMKNEILHPAVTELVKGIKSRQNAELH